MITPVDLLSTTSSSSNPLYSHVRDELKVEALQFVKEQRIRSLLSGAWFPVTAPSKSDVRPGPYRFVRLSHNRRYLHYCDYEAEMSFPPKLEELPERIDLSTVSSVVSNVVPASISSASSSGTLTQTTGGNKMLASTTVTIHGYTSSKGKEVTLLMLHPQTHSTASEWLDGLLMLLNQQPITSETSKLVNMVTNYGLKIRLLNVRYTDDYSGVTPELPSRDGVDEDYYYSLF